MGSGAWRHLPALQPGPEDAAISLETATFVNSLVETWPDGSSDTVSQGDDHIRLLKASIKRTFPNIAGEVSVSSAEINVLKHVAGWMALTRSASSVSTLAFQTNGVADQFKLRGGGRIDLTNGTVEAILSYSVTPTFQVGTISNHNMDLVANNSTRMVIRGDGPFKTQTFTVATLPAAATVGTGARSFVTDANATTFASIVAGGGSNQLPVYSDGTNWRIG